MTTVLVIGGIVVGFLMGSTFIKGFNKDLWVVTMEVMEDHYGQEEFRELFTNKFQPEIKNRLTGRN